MCCKVREDDPDTFPQSLPIFPLEGVLLLPRGQLPLHIFEAHNIDMIDDALADSRMIGIIQPRANTGAHHNATNNNGNEAAEQVAAAPVYDTGCAGKIISFEETDDGRYLVTLRGVTRFRVARELDNDTNYRRVETHWHPFRHDTHPASELDICRDKLNNLLWRYFEQHQLKCCWDKIDHAPDERLITALCMICPFTAQEKQALLEAHTCQERAELIMAMLDMAICGDRTAGSQH
jgi:hypothetical protein